MVCICFVLALAAGVCVGLLAGRSASGPRRGSLLSRELDLTREQREQMRQIWSEVMRATGERQRERRHALREEREKAVQALLTDEQKPQYEQLMEEYARRLDELSQEGRKRFEEAVEKTKQTLTEAQRKKYEEFLEKRPWGPHSGRRGREREGSDLFQPRHGDEE